jgi:hypothetical protein
MTRSAASTAAMRWTVTGCTMPCAWLILTAMPASSLGRQHLVTHPTH